MNKYYLEVIFTDNQNVLFAGLFYKMHGYFFVNEINSVGIFFPDSGDKGLGNRMRIFGSIEELSQVIKQDFMIKADRNSAVPIVLKEVPEDVLMGYTSRVQSKMSQSKIRSIKAKYGHDIELKSVEKISPPFLKMTSTSNKNTFFYRFENHVGVKDETPREFNPWGFGGIVPIF